MMDKHKVFQILVNLIRNARHAVEDGPKEVKRLTVRCRSNGSEMVKIAVADKGVGITAENLNRIFEHGFTTRKSGHGFGLHNSMRDVAAQDLVRTRDGKAFQ